MPRPTTRRAPRPAAGDDAADLPHGTAAPDTRTKIVLAAERLFAERGMSAVPLRDVVAAAGQRNASAIQYHFGPNPDLVTAVFQYRMTQINERRMELLALMHVGGQAADTRSLVEALVRPLADAVADPGCHYAQFLAQMSSHPSYRVPETWQIASSLRAVREGLRRSLDHLPDDIFAERWRMIVHLFIQTIADHEEDRATAPPVPATPGWVDRLIDACLAVLTVPAAP